MRPPSLHTRFFSSLKQVERRLNSENPSQPPNLCSSSSTDHFSSPIYLKYDQHNNSSTLQDSDPPQEFLSHSLDFPPTHEDPPRLDIEKHDQIDDEADEDRDDIERLMELLGLSEEEEQQKKPSGGSCYCHGGFYSKIVGAKGPKCVKEMERLDGWIKYFLNDGGGERREPLRLVHLLLGRAACVGEDGGASGDFEFPPTVEEFLQNDPPIT